MFILLQSTLTSPNCGHVSEEEMPLDACLYFYECVNCHQLLHPESGDCCVFCSYGSSRCPEKQIEQSYITLG